MTRAISHVHAGAFEGEPRGSVVLAHDERHLRRKLLALEEGGEVLVDLPQAVALGHGDALVLEDGSLVEVLATEEALYEVTARDRTHLARLCWHLGNRHLPAEISEERILIARDHVIHDMLIGRGAGVQEVAAPLSPERGAYHRHSHAHGDDHHHHHG